MVKKQMKTEQERYQKAMEEQQKQYESKMKQDTHIEHIRQKMKDIRKQITEANEIAKFMNKDVVFTDIYVTKFDD